jgi:lipopolysaccharide transport system ATP-binding protein
MTSVISVENLSKQYIIGHQKQENYNNLREEITQGVSRFLTKLTHPFAEKKEDFTHEEFWALKDISFDIQQGERIGIIGGNGAGKSTLLKILSRITEPTSGKVSIKGRVASLLEVGTGFHPELSGRENVFLNGAILGMSKAEIKKLFDEIVAFAEVEKFLDTPVKRYSSGMYVRLAFSVAAHLGSEILIVDEVLGVGDANFQKKCMGKIEDASNDGRTVLFVSHSMSMISELCQKGILLKHGGVLFQGAMSDTLMAYHQDNRGNQSENYNRPKSEYESENIILLAVELAGAGGALGFTIHDELVIRMKYRIKKEAKAKFVPEFHFNRADDSYAFVTYAEDVIDLPSGEYIAECKIPGRLLNDGPYIVGAAMAGYFSDHWNTEFYDPNALTFTIVDPMDQRANRYGFTGLIPGAVRPKLEWNINRSKDN